MECSKRNPAGRINVWLVACAALLFIFAGCGKINETPQLSIITVASGLAGPMGIEADRYGNIWVSEAGTDTLDESGSTHNNDGKVIVITPNGKKYDAIVNLASYANVNSNELQGTVNILRERDTLYVLSGDNLYKANVSHWKPGDKPLDAHTLPSEDIAAVVSQISSPNNPDKDSHPYNLTIGPKGGSVHCRCRS